MGRYEKVSGCNYILLKIKAPVYSLSACFGIGYFNQLSDGLLLKLQDIEVGYYIEALDLNSTSLTM